MIRKRNEIAGVGGTRVEGRARIGRARVLLALIIWMSLALVSVVQAETTLSVEEFNTQESKWSTLLDTTLQIEGRYSIFSPNQLRMEKCKLDFVFAREFTSPAGDSKTIVVKGRLEKREPNKLVFVVSDLKPQISDVEQFRSLRGKVPSNKPEEWYKLADTWAKRAKFYRDDALKAETVAAYKQGVLAEHRNLSQPTPLALRTLAQKLASWNADPTLQQEFQHEAFRMDFGQVQKNSGAGDGELLTELARTFPGTDVPLTKDDEAARELYLKSPLVAFKDGDADQRKKFARVFYVEIMKYRILREASPDGKNGFDIAKRIESQLPEYQALVPEYRAKEREYHLGRVGSMTRKEMLALVTRFESLGDPDYLTSLKQQWFLQRERQVDPTSAAALVELGDDYNEFMHDRDAAIRLYKRAYVVSPGVQAISDWLKEEGLTLRGGEWLAKGEVPPEPDDPLAAAVRAGTVREKMTEEQVRSALGGEPTRRTRVATSGGFQEWWLFEDHGLSIEFTRRRSSDTPHVTKVTGVKKRSRPVEKETPRPTGSKGF